MHVTALISVEQHSPSTKLFSQVQQRRVRMKTAVTLLTIALGLMVACATASEFTSPEVVHLTAKNYEDAVSVGQQLFLCTMAGKCQPGFQIFSFDTACVSSALRRR